MSFSIFFLLIIGLVLLAATAQAALIDNGYSKRAEDLFGLSLISIVMSSALFFASL